VGRAAIVRRGASVAGVIDETARAESIVLDVPGWPGHSAGQHVDVRLTAEDGYQTERSYSIASAPEDARLALTVERIDDGEVSPYLTGELGVGDELELRGPIGGYFTWRARDGGPLLLIAGGSGLVPLMAMLRHRTANASIVDARLLHPAAPRVLLGSARGRTGFQAGLRVGHRCYQPLQRPWDAGRQRGGHVADPQRAGSVVTRGAGGQPRHLRQVQHIARLPEQNGSGVRCSASRPANTRRRRHPPSVRRARRCCPTRSGR
jgi:hypothetical protein